MADCLLRICAGYPYLRWVFHSNLLEDLLLRALFVEETDILPEAQIRDKGVTGQRATTLFPREYKLD